MVARKVPAAEVRRLARLRELARAHRRSGRALERAILAAQARGISVRKIAAATGLASMSVHRMVTRPNAGQAKAASGPEQPANRATKRKRGGK